MTAFCNIHQNPGLLTAPEQNDFDLIVANARSSGWIHTEQYLTVERVASAIVVRSQLAERVCECHYRDDPCWVYQLLHDLAHGRWRQ